MRIKRAWQVLAFSMNQYWLDRFGTFGNRATGRHHVRRVFRGKQVTVLDIQRRLAGSHGHLRELPNGQALIFEPTPWERGLPTWVTEPTRELGSIQ